MKESNNDDDDEDDDKQNGVHKLFKNKNSEKKTKPNQTEMKKKILKQIVKWLRKEKSLDVCLNVCVCVWTRVMWMKHVARVTSIFFFVFAEQKIKDP